MTDSSHEKHRRPLHIITRQQLHKKIWSTPALHLATEFGISGRGLAKICASHDIPVPPHGWWARRDPDHKLTPRVLPTTRPKDEEIIIGQSTGARQKHFAAEIKAEAALVTVLVPDTLENPHPLVTRTLRALTVSADNDGLTRPRRNATALDVQVSSDQQVRSLRILQAVITTLEASGLSVSVDRTRKTTVVSGLEEAMEISLREQLESVTRETTPEELRRRASEPWFEIPCFRSVPAGSLTLAITNAEVLGVRQRWADGKRQRLEACLGGFIAGLRLAARAIRAEKERTAERAREHEEWRKAWEENRRAQALFDLRAKALLQQLTAWRDARDIRAMAADVERRMETLGVSDGSGSHDWVTWARLYADMLDPAAGTLRSLPGTEDLPRTWRY